MCDYEDDKLAQEFYSHQPNISVTRTCVLALDLDQGMTLIHPDPEHGHDSKQSINIRKHTIF